MLEVEVPATSWRARLYRHGQWAMRGFKRGQGLIGWQMGLAEVALDSPPLTVGNLGLGEVLQVLLEGPAFSLPFTRQVLVRAVEARKLEFLEQNAHRFGRTRHTITNMLPMSSSS